MMSHIIAVGEVDDLRTWEERFRTRGELFKSQSVVSPIRFATSEKGNEIAICFEVGDVDTFFEVLESPATAEAMAQDGVKRDTVRFFVVDKEFAI